MPSDPSADPYCRQGVDRREAASNDVLRYLKTDFAGDEAGLAVLAPAYNSERQIWENRAVVSFDFPPYLEAQSNGADIGGGTNGLDVFEIEGRYVSIVGTSDGGGGVQGWASGWGDGCQFFDGWISYDKTNIPSFVASAPSSWASIRSSIAQVRNPRYERCPGSFNQTTTYWTYVPEFTFAGVSTCGGQGEKKTTRTIVSDHVGGDHHEVFYFTDEYGAKTRWERWQCDERNRFDTDRYIQARCDYENAQSIMVRAFGQGDQRTIRDRAGKTCYLVDCRDFTTTREIDLPGYKMAAWHHNAPLFYSGNVLGNGDFNRGRTGWSSLGTTASIEQENGNHYMRVSADGTGWESVLGVSLDEFNRLFDGAYPQARLGKHMHWGARVRRPQSSGGTARLAVVEWGNAGGERIHESGLTLTNQWQWVKFDRLLGPSTNRLDVRLRLDALQGLEVDDVYLYLDHRPGH